MPETKHLTAEEASQVASEAKAAREMGLGIISNPYWTDRSEWDEEAHYLWNDTYFQTGTDND